MDPEQYLSGGKVYLAPLGTDMPTVEELERGAGVWNGSDEYIARAVQPHHFSTPEEEAATMNRAQRRAAERRARKARRA